MHLDPTSNYSADSRLSTNEKTLTADSNTKRSIKLIKVNSPETCFKFSLRTQAVIDSIAKRRQTAAAPPHSPPPAPGQQSPSPLDKLQPFPVKRTLDGAVFLHGPEQHASL